MVGSMVRVQTHQSIILFNFKNTLSGACAGLKAIIFQSLSSLSSEARLTLYYYPLNLRSGLKHTKGIYMCFR